MGVAGGRGEAVGVEDVEGDAAVGFTGVFGVDGDVEFAAAGVLGVHEAAGVNVDVVLAGHVGGEKFFAEVGGLSVEAGSKWVMAAGFGAHDAVDGAGVVAEVLEDGLDDFKAPLGFFPGVVVEGFPGVGIVGDEGVDAMRRGIGWGPSCPLRSRPCRCGRRS